MRPYRHWPQYCVLKLLISLMMLCGVPDLSWAFKMSPCLRVLTMENGKLSQSKVRWHNLCESLPKKYKSAVHEHMTLGSIRQYRGDGVLERTRRGWRYSYIHEPPWRYENNGHVHSSKVLIYGTWWNDDPLMFTWAKGEGKALINGAIKFSRSLKDNRKAYPGGREGCNDVPKNQHLVRWSHFGKLQYLHFMTEKDAKKTTAEVRVSLTTDRALTWMKFAYRVATGDLKPEARLTTALQKRLGLPSIASNECVNPKNVRVRTVFTPISWLPVSDRDEATPDVALGSMLHILQDSWSPSHTCRVEQGIGNTRIAVLKDVKNYNEQIVVKGGETAHSNLDQYPQWLIDEVVHGDRVYKNDPVAVGAWLLAGVDKKLPWSDVEKHLRETIFLPMNSQGSEDNKPCIGLPPK